MCPTPAITASRSSMPQATSSACGARTCTTTLERVSSYARSINCQTGDDGGFGGEMDEPEGVAVNAAGDVYVADRSNRRIQKFDPSGNWQRAWGKDVDTSQAGTGPEICTVAASCQGGDSGGAFGGEFQGLTGIATDSAGTVYATDQERVQKFDSSGSFLLAWGRDVVSGGGTGFEICGVAASCKLGVSWPPWRRVRQPPRYHVDAADNVYVGDANNNRIQKFADPVAPPPPDPGEAVEAGRSTRRRLTRRSPAARSRRRRRATRASSSPPPRPARPSSASSTTTPSSPAPRLRTSRSRRASTPSRSAPPTPRETPTRRRQRRAGPSRRKRSSRAGVSRQSAASAARRLTSSSPATLGPTPASVGWATTTGPRGPDTTATSKPAD